MKHLNILLFILISGWPGTALCQAGMEPFRVMLYNTENLFDPFDDSLTLDDEFTPVGVKHWNYYKFRIKINNLYKVIVSAGGWIPPDLVGLCEIENRWVLDRLVQDTPLAKYEYRVIHYDSDDPRGTDLAFLYRESSFKPVDVKVIRVRFDDEDEEPTRDILYVKGVTGISDTLHLFINHWPSRYTGQVASSRRRMAAAVALKRQIDTVLYNDKDAMIIVFGDFNDEPTDISLKDILQMCAFTDNPSDGKMYNILPDLTGMAKGTCKYQGRWYLFDQFMVSGSLLNNVEECKVKLIDHSFLLEEDEVHLGYKPFRTYDGFKYRGGFSDHLPVVLEIFFR